MKPVDWKKEHMLSYSTLWPGMAHPALSAVLEGVPLQAALADIAYLLHRLVTRKKDTPNFHVEELIYWTLNADGEPHQLAANFIVEQNPFNIEGFTLTNRRNCLDLLQELLRATNAPGDELSKSHRGALLKALLIINSRYLESQLDMFNWDGSDDADKFLDIVLPAKISDLGIGRMRDYQVQLIKASYFFEFCASDAEYSIYLTCFLDHYGFKRYDEYLGAIFHPYLRYMSEEKPTPLFRIAPEYQEAIAFFDQFAVNGHAIDTTDFRTLRAYPVFKCDSNTFIFLFNNFLADKLYQGLLFDFARVLQQTGYSKLTFGKLKNDMGNRFSEHKLFYRAMSNCFGHMGQLWYTGEQLKQKLKQGEPDLYIRDGRKVFLFEFKDVLLRAEAKGSADASVIREELLEKLDTTNKSQPKATKQLLESIKRLLAGDYREAGIEPMDPEQLVIYPVIVHTDIALEAEGVNYFLKERFNQLLREAGLPKKRIKDLVIVNIDMLISIQDLFARQQLKLGNCINDFIVYTRSGKVLNQMMPFDEYLKFDIVSKGYSFQKSSEEFLALAKSLSEAR